MVKHIQTIRRLLTTNCLSVFDHCGVGAERVNINYLFYLQNETTVYLCSSAIGLIWKTLLFSLTHISPLFHFYTPENVKNQRFFLTVSGSVGMENWTKMGEIIFSLDKCHRIDILFGLVLFKWLPEWFFQTAILQTKKIDVEAIAQILWSCCSYFSFKI